MQQLGLSEISNSRVGNAAKRGISGGEQRRLSIGIELVTDPPILFLDEPTSGLDSYQASQVVHILDDLAHKYGKTVILTIHQPRSDVFARFDKLMLLSRGSCMYHGPRDQVTAFLKDIGRECPPNYNVADHILDVATVPASHSPVNVVTLGSDTVGSLTRRSVGSKPQDTTSEVRHSNVTLSSVQHEATGKDGYSWVDVSNLAGYAFASGYLTQFTSLLDRSWKDFCRRPSLFVSHLGASIVLGGDFCTV
jgi:ABC-type multidrug transport system ATPase subunit